MIKNRRKLIKPPVIIAVFLLVAICTGVLFCNYDFALANNNLPELIDNQWYDSAEFLNFEATLSKVDDLLSSLSDEKKAFLKEQPIVIAVLDTGINLNHEIFEGLLYTNSGEIASDGKDNDNNGFTDDVCGWDFVNKDADVKDDCTSPDSHGTHVCGIIAREIKKYGLNDYIKILPIKVGNKSGNFNADVIVDAINYAKARGADIINMSFCSYTTVKKGLLYVQNTEWDDKSRLYQTIDAAKKDCLFIAAVGNDTLQSDKRLSSPAGFDNVIGVMAYQKDDTLWTTDKNNSNGYLSGSNYGDAYAFALPGAMIYGAVRDSYVAKEGDGYFADTDKKNGYAKKSGTSMATPIASFMSAVMLIKYDKNIEMVNFILNNFSSDQTIDGYKKASLSALLDYKSIDEIVSEKTNGELIQDVLNMREIEFFTKIKYYNSSSYAPVDDEIYNSVYWVVQKCDSVGNRIGDELTFNCGSSFKFKPDNAGNYKIYSRVGNYDYLNSNEFIVKINYASLDEVSLSINGESKIYANETSYFAVNGLEYLDPNKNNVIWYIYRDGILVQPPQSSFVLNYYPETKGNYKLVCKLETNAETVTVGEINIKVLMDKEKASEIIGGVVTGLIILILIVLIMLNVIRRIKLFNHFSPKTRK